MLCLEHHRHVPRGDTLCTWLYSLVFYSCTGMSHPAGEPRRTLPYTDGVLCAVDDEAQRPRGRQALVPHSGAVHLPDVQPCSCVPHAFHVEALPSWRWCQEPLSVLELEERRALARSRQSLRRRRKAIGGRKGSAGGFTVHGGLGTCAQRCARARFISVFVRSVCVVRIIRHHTHHDTPPGMHFPAESLQPKGVVQVHTTKNGGFRDISINASLSVWTLPVAEMISLEIRKTRTLYQVPGTMVVVRCSCSIP